jgi:endonuclease/exonuclease/phosphatase family metal-dependent hydrolase
MKKNKTSFWHKIILFFNYIAVISLLLSYAATVIDPAQFWYLTLFGLAYPFILVANLLFLLFWILCKKWTALLSLITLLIGFGFIQRTFAFRLESASDFTVDSNTIKVMTWNVHSFKKFGDELDTLTKTNALNIIKTEQPDIAGFQEFFTRKKGKYDFKDSILKYLDTKFYYYSKTSDNDFESNGVAFFSKYPIVASGEIELETPNAGNKGIWADVKKENTVIRVFVVHLASISFAPEDYHFLNEVKSDINTGKDVQSSKRIVRKLRDAFIRRSNQVKVLKAEMAKCRTPYLVMGDFNDTPVSYSISQVTKGLKNGFKEKGSGLAITYNGAFPNFQIDYILSSPQFDFKGYKIIKKDYSDHYPVRCNLSLSK